MEGFARLIGSAQMLERERGQMRAAALARGRRSALGGYGGGLEFEDDAGEVHVIPGFGDLSVGDVDEAGSGEACGAAGGRKS